MAWRIYVGAGFTRDIGEGPFDSQADAIHFAECEVGVAWTVREDGAEATDADPKWIPESNEARAAREAREAAQTKRNRDFHDAETAFIRDNPNASADDFRRFVKEWMAHA